MYLLAAENVRYEKWGKLYSNYTEGNQGKTKGWQIKLLQVAPDHKLPNLPKIFTAKIFYYLYNMY